jgi:hypothetical protein
LKNEFLKDDLSRKMWATTFEMIQQKHRIPDQDRKRSPYVSRKTFREGDRGPTIS